MNLRCLNVPILNLEVDLQQRHLAFELSFETSLSNAFSFELEVGKSDPYLA